MQRSSLCAAENAEPTVRSSYRQPTIRGNGHSQLEDLNSCSEAYRRDSSGPDYVYVCVCVCVCVCVQYVYYGSGSNADHRLCTLTIEEITCP